MRYDILDSTFVRVLGLVWEGRSVGARRINFDSGSTCKFALARAGAQSESIHFVRMSTLPVCGNRE